MTMDGLGFDAPHLARMQQVDAVEHPDRPRRDQVAGHAAQPGPRHGGVVDALRQACLDLDAQIAHRLAHGLQGLGVGDAQVAVVAALQAAALQTLLDLRPGAVHQQQTDAQAVQQGQVVHQAVELGPDHRLAAEVHHEAAPAMGVDVRGGVAEPEQRVVFVRWHGHSLLFRIIAENGASPHVRLKPVGCL